MRKILRPAVILFIAALIVIQFFRPKKNKSTASVLAVNDISRAYHVPDDVQKILEASCYDCHSNNTNYPWYNNIQPVAWWLDDHVKEGKKELNFSEFASYRIGRQYRKLEEISKEVQEDEMPLQSYTFVHTDAKLSKPQKISIANWVAGLRDTIKSSYPADSLKRPPRPPQIPPKN